MSQKSRAKKPDSQVVSVRLPYSLYELLETKTQEMENEKNSETIRNLLESVLENPKPNKQLQYTILTYSLIQEAILSLVEDPQSLIDRAEAKARKLSEEHSE